jgi:hypothetical protein
MVWNNDSRVGSKSLFNLVEFIKMDRDLKDELKQFENVFKKNDIVKLWKYKT